jgi:hypothetical protein
LWLIFRVTAVSTGAAVRVGEAPVGLALVDDDRVVVVAGSNRFDVPGETTGLTFVDATAMLDGKPALLGVVPAGLFPRELSLEGDGHTLLVTNFASGQVEAVNTQGLP